MTYVLTILGHVHHRLYTIMNKRIEFSFRINIGLYTLNVIIIKLIVACVFKAIQDTFFKTTQRH